MAGVRSFKRVAAICLPLCAWAVATAAVVRGNVGATRIPRPQIPDRTFELSAFGSNGDGKTLNTAAFQKAVDAIKQDGGGVLHVPAGIFLTAPFHLTGRMNLHLEKGATIKFIGFDEEWPKEDGKDVQYGILADGCDDVAITGEGAIDGQGQLCWDRYRKVRDPETGKFVPPQEAPHRPRLVVLRGCTRVLIEGVTFRNSPSFHLVPDHCENVIIDGAHFVAPSNAPNTDGLDPSGWNYLITHCTFDVGDDCIAIKASQRPPSGRPSCENFTITDCTFKHGHGMSIGSQTRGGLRNLVVRDCTFEGTEAGIRMKSSRGIGGLVEDLTYDNLTMKNVKVPIYITSYYPTAPADAASDPPQPVTDTTPIWRNIHISHVSAEGAETAGIVMGTPEARIRDLTMEDVSLHAKKGMLIVNAQGVRVLRLDVKAAKGEPVIVRNAEVTGLGASNPPATSPQQN